MSSPISDPAYSSSMSAGGGERTLHSVTDGTLAGGTESSTSFTETTSSPGPAQPVSVEQSGTANASTSSGSFVEFATETLFTHSSKIPTYSSFQNDLTSKLVSPGVHLGGTGKFTLSCIYLCCIQSSLSLVRAMPAAGSLRGMFSSKDSKPNPELFQK